MSTILVTVDSLRADHLAQYGYDRNTMPVLDRISEQGTLFTNAYSNAPYTRISIPSFHTSQYLAYEYLEKVPTVASILEEEGVRTAAVGTQTGVNLVQGDFGFQENIDLGRDEYHKEANSNRPPIERLRYMTGRMAYKFGTRLLNKNGAIYEMGKNIWDSITGNNENFRYLGYTSAENVTDRAISWLESNYDEQFFLWIHYMEAHRPYGVHVENPSYADRQPSKEEIQRLMKKAGLTPDKVTDEEKQRLKDLYDSDLRYCSDHIGRLMNRLDTLGIWDGTNIIFSSDHGEEFYEHGQYFHRNYPYDELIHVPLLVKSIEDQPEKIHEQRELLDIAPTVCQWHSMNPESLEFEGKPLFDHSERKVIALGSAKPEHDNVIAGRWDGWKYIYSNEGTQLYNIEDDPLEMRSMATNKESIVSQFRQTIPDALYERKPERLNPPDSETDLEQLEALGYLEMED